MINNGIKIPSRSCGGGFWQNELILEFPTKSMPSSVVGKALCRLHPRESLLGSTGQSSIPGRWLLDRAVKPSDDSIVSVILIEILQRPGCKENIHSRRRAKNPDTFSAVAPS